MKSSAFRQWIAAGCLLVMIALMTGLYAEESPKIADDKKIRISSDSMMADSQSKFVEFVGNVKASQGDTVITADRLKIFYKEVKAEAKEAKKELQGSNSVDKVVAQGNVRVQLEDKVAETQEAVYTTSDRILVLSGEDSRLISGNDSITGSKITFYRDSGRVKVESSGKKSVEAVVFSGEKGLN